MRKAAAVVLMLLGFPFILLGMVLGFVWEHLDMGWCVGRSSSAWLGDRAEEIRESIARRPA